MNFLLQLKKIKWFGRNFLVFVTGVAAVSYIFFLLVFNYRMISELQDQSQRKFDYQMGRYSEVLGTFFCERKDDLLNLALARETSVFFENKALGMSMEYGLGQCLLPLADKFQSLILRKKVNNISIYKRLLFIERSGALLVDTSQKHEAPLEWRTLLAPLYRTGSIITSKDQKEIVVSFAYYFKGRFAGQILAWLNPVVLNQVLLGENNQQETCWLVFKDAPSRASDVIFSSSTSEYHVALSADFNFPSVENLSEKKTRSVELPQSNTLLLSTPIPQTPFILVWQVKDALAYKQINPKGYLVGMGLVSCIIILATYFTIRQNMKARLLKAHLEESILREQKIREKEGALRESEERLSLVLDGSSNGFWDWDIPSGKISINERWADMLGYSLEEIKPHVNTWENLMHPDDMVPVFSALNAHLEGRTHAYESEHRLRHKSGNWVWVLDRGRVIVRDSQGVPLRACGTHLDITDRVLQDEEIHRSQTNLNSFFDLSVDFLFVLDLSGNILKVNHTVIERLGFSEQELIGANILVVHPAEVRDEAGVIVQEMLAGSKDCCPLPLLAKDGRRIPVETRIVRGYWDNKPALYGTSKDISDLAFSEEKFAKAFEFSSSLMAISTIEDGRYLDVNRSFVETLGFSREEVIGKTSIELGLFTDSKLRQKLANVVMEGGELSNFEMAVPSKNSEPRIGLFSAKRIRIQLNSYLLTVMNDITELKHMEKKLETAMKNAELASAAKSLFVANVSHEIRTPLNEILGLGHLLSDTQLSEKQRDYQVKLIRAAKALLCLINDILDFSKIEAGKLDILDKPFNLRETFNATLESFRSLAIAKGLELSGNLSLALPCQLVGDSHRLSQILGNLVHNALKFTDRGMVAVSAEVVSLVQDKVEIEFQVSDTGIGISLEAREKLFKSFSQVDDTSTRRYGGTGLGLAISKQLCEAMGGTILLDSSTGRGSNFIVRIPFYLAGEEVAATQEISASDRFSAGVVPCFRGARILVVDDNEINRQIAEELLIKTGAEVVLADDGRQAVSLVHDELFDVVLMDIQMPVVDGLTATVLIRALDTPGAKTLPILAMTANAMSGDREKSLAAGLSDHLTKPIEPDELYEIIFRWLPTAKCAAPDILHGKVTDAVSFSISGVNVDAGLRRAGGNLDLYHKLLRKFAINHVGNEKTVRQHLEEGQVNEARRLAHSVKGIAGNLGIESLYQAAALLEESIIADASDIDEKLSSFGKNLKSFIESVSTAFPCNYERTVTGSDDLPVGKLENLKEIMLQLEDPIRTHRPRECRAVTSVLFCYYWPWEQARELVELTDLLDQYQFEAADEVRQRLLGTLSG
ncbi:MAG: PAS domain S-box protein [Desulfobulbus sp.]|nr:PAS domain S-box protein [Desulfobulbus sp.]